MPKISVIMPSLNVVQFYSQCIESVLNQSITDIEILAVDAGSTDGTLEILSKYVELDDRIRVINSPIKSYGAQMNLGLDNATGDYIAFLETDDFLCSYALERLYSIAKEDDLDYVKGWTYSFWDESDGSRRVLDEDKIFLVLPHGEGIFSPCECPKLLISDFHVWNGLYKRNFLKEIRFNETKGAAFQDIGFIIQYLTKAKAARYIDLPVYYYRRSNGLSSVYNQSGFKYLADEYEGLMQSGIEMTKIQWRFVWNRMLIQIFTRFETMYKSVKPWLSVDDDLQRLRALLKQADLDGKLGEMAANDIYARLLQLMLVGDFTTLKSSAWLETPIGHLVDAFEKDNFLIYGAGKRGRMMVTAALKMKKYPPLAFVDSNPQMWGGIVAGTRVVSLDEARNKYPKARYVIAVKGQEQIIREILISIGIDSGNITCFDIETSQFNQYMEYVVRNNANI